MFLEGHSHTSSSSSSLSLPILDDPSAPEFSVTKVEVPATFDHEWTEEDKAAIKIQAIARGFLGRKARDRVKKKKRDYEKRMEKLEKEVKYSHAYRRSQFF